MHGFAMPQRIDAALVTYLQQQGSPRWYLAELTPREAMAVNVYIAGGSDAPLKAVFDRFAHMGLQWGNQNFFEKLTILRKLNEALPSAREVRFIGIDLDRKIEGFDAIFQVPLVSSEDITPDLTNIQSAQAINSALLAVEPERRNRYAAMKKRMSALAEMVGFEDANFVGLWGLFHASEANINGATPLSAWLQDAGAPYGGDVVTINTLCIGTCYNMMPASALPSPLQGKNGEAYTWIPMGIQSPYFQRPKGIGDLIAALGENKMALFFMAGEESPYAEGNRLVENSGYLSMLRPWKVSGSASDMTDYLLIYRDTAPLTPWRGDAFDMTGKASETL